jgi:serine/threonine protein kinase
MLDEWRYVPSKIGSYQLSDTIGSGTYSIVKSAVNITDGSLAAVKILSKSELSAYQVESQFQRDVTTISRITHPNIVQFQCHFQDSYYHYLVMEFCPNGHLFDHIGANGSSVNLNRAVYSMNCARRFRICILRISFTATSRRKTFCSTTKCT